MEKAFWGYGKKRLMSSLNKKSNNWKYYLILTTFAIIVYWPISFNVFSLKNDAISYFLPWRYHVSESIQNGYFPFWSPYLHTGLPLHADIQSGVWNPIVFIVSCITTYNMSILQWETLLYIILGGIGFFKLCRFFSFDRRTSLFVSTAYICNGFIIDSASFIPWITSAAYIPYVLFYFLNLTRSPNWTTCLKLSISLFLLFTAGYTSFFILTCYILFFIVAYKLYYDFFIEKRKFNFYYIKLLFASAFLSLLLSGPALLSYIDFFPYYDRGNGASLNEVQFNPFNFKNLISYLLPNASYKLPTSNDISSRNAYIGLLPLLFFFYSFKNKWSFAQKAIFLICCVTFLFSLGNATPIRSWFYHAFPLMDSFRHPSTVRLFTNIGLLLLSGFGLINFVNEPADKLLILLCKILSIVFCVSLLLIINNNDNFLHVIDIATSFKSQHEKLKNIIDKSSAIDWAIGGIVIQTLFLFALIIYQKPLNRAKIVSISIINLSLFTWMAMPYTHASQYPTSSVNSFIRSFDKGYPLSLAKLQVKDNNADKNDVHLFGYKNYYKKRITIQDFIYTPTINSSYRNFLKDSLVRQEIMHHPFIYTNNNTPIIIKKFTPNRLQFNVTLKSPSTVFITQQYNHNWSAIVNSYPHKVERSNIAFMKIKLPKGNHKVIMKYMPKYIWITLSLSIVTLCIILLLLGMKHFNRK